MYRKGINNLSIVAMWGNDRPLIDKVSRVLNTPRSVILYLLNAEFFRVRTGYLHRKELRYVMGMTKDGYSDLYAKCLKNGVIEPFKGELIKVTKKGEDILSNYYQMAMNEINSKSNKVARVKRLGVERAKKEMEGLPASRGLSDK